MTVDHSSDAAAEKTYVIPKKMTAAVLVSKGVLEVQHDIPVGEPGMGEILIKLLTCGICHSDLHLYKMDFTAVPVSLPRIIGHEGVGVVVKLGPGVTSLKLGDRVGSSWMYNACQKCCICLEGKENKCPDQLQTGLSVEGCYAEYIVAKEAFVCHIPDSIASLNSAPLLCAGVTSYSAVKGSGVQAGQWISIFGAAGGLGHLAVSFAKAMGMKVLAVDMGADKEALCMNLGADAFVDLSPLPAGTPDMMIGGASGTQVGMLMAASKGGAQAAVVFAPVCSVYETALLSIRNGGKVMACGLSLEDIKVNTLSLILGGKSLCGSVIGSRADMQDMLQLAEHANIIPTVKECAMKDLPEIFEKFEKRQIVGRYVLRIAKEE